MKYLVYDKLASNIIPPRKLRIKSALGEMTDRTKLAFKTRGAAKNALIREAKSRGLETKHFMIEEID
jgi:hypothetical protein